MPGMLQYGAMAGVGKEWLKQSAEGRQNEYQEIRDRRLSEIRMGEAAYAADLTRQENIRQEGVQAEAAASRSAHETREREAKQEFEAGEAEKTREHERTLPHNVPGGAAAIDASGKVLHEQPKTFAPSAEGAKAIQFEKESVKIRGSGTQRKSSELYDEWHKQAYAPVTDDLGVTVYRRREDVPDWITWHNSMVVDEDRIQPDDPKYMAGDPDAILDWAMRNKPDFPQQQDRLIQGLMQKYPWWQGPQAEQPPAPPPAEPAPPAEPQTPPPAISQPENAAGVATAGRPGMLSTGQQIQVQQPSSQVFGGSIQRRIAELEQELARIETMRGPGARSAEANKRAIVEEIAALRRQLGG